MAQSDWTRLGGISRDAYVATGANVEAYVTAQIGATYKAKGSLAFANLPTPGASYEGFVYNVTDAFTTIAAFVEGAGKNYPAGTNVVCVNTTGSTYAWDVLTGIVDLSGKQDKITASGILKGDGSGGVSAATAGTDYVAPSALDGYVPTTRKVNGKALSSDITLGCSDIATPTSVGTTLADWAQQVENVVADLPSGQDILVADSTGVVYRGGTKVSPLSDITVGGTGVVAGITAAAAAAAAAAGTADTAVQSVKISGSSTELKSGTTATIPVASTSAKGVVQLSDSTASDVSTTAATSKAVKAAKDAADAAATAASSAGTTASNNAAARKTTLKTAIDTMYSRTIYPDKQSLYAALEDMDDLADTLADLIIALRGFCDAS